ncbi:MAG: hypothetical protein R2785_10850 [Flavobacteriaceae bacterium]
MKTIATIVLICFSVLFSFAQNPLKLTIIKGADKPNTESEHDYLLEISNTSKTDFTFVITANNTSCSDQKLMQQTELMQEIYNAQKSKKLNSMSIASGKTLEFYVRLTRPDNAKKNSWNCTQIKAVSGNGSAISNTITIESLIPNPKDAN